MFCEIFRIRPQRVFPSVLKSVTLKQHNLLDQSQPLTFIEHLLIPGSWFGLKLYALQRVCHFQNCPWTGRISGWVIGFARCLNNSGALRTLNTILCPRSWHHIPDLSPLFSVWVTRSGSEDGRIFWTESNDVLSSAEHSCSVLMPQHSAAEKYFGHHVRVCSCGLVSRSL